jgi:23S rRNA pseudouridine2605 synthase
MDDKETGHKGGERIAKVIARAGLASRREAEAWIAAGRVAVNGAPIASPALNVTDRDRITVDGEPLPTRERTRLFLYNKARGLITTHADPQGRPTIFQRLPKDLPRLISVGRLDFNTEGLLLLTNDGALARVLELPTTGWLRRYRVRVHGTVTQAQLDALHEGVTISGIHYGVIEASIERVQGSNLWLSFGIREGKNREVRTVLGHLGLDVTRLIRVSFGPFQLAELAEGGVEEVKTRVLREQLGTKLVALSGADFSAPPRPPRPPKRDKPEAPQQKPVHHAWRPREEERPGKKLRRKYHGSDAETEIRRQPPAGKARKDALTDRKGRVVPVERHGETKRHGEAKRDHEPRQHGGAPPRGDTRKPFEKRGRSGNTRPQRRHSPDRSAGPRPRNPRSR